METPTKREVLKKMLNGERADALKRVILVCHRNTEGQLMHGSKLISQQNVDKFVALIVETRSPEQAEEIQRYVNKLATMDFTDNQIVKR